MPTATRTARLLLPALLLAALATHGAAQVVDLQQMAADIQSLKAENTTLRQDYQRLNQNYGSVLQLAQSLQQQLDAALAQQPAGPAADDEFYIPRMAGSFDASGLPQGFGSIYTKPFLSELGSNTHIGGYIDFEMRNPSGDDKNKEFDQHRLVPFLYADVSDRIKVATEVEIEHGSELEVEFAQVDYLISDAANFRAGIQLLPLGKLNEVHDSPIQDLTDRPLVNRYIIPTTLRDSGVGLYGNITEDITYHTTLTNGFKGLKSDGSNAITSKDGLRKAAPQAENDDLDVEPFDQINDDFAWTSRVAWRPVLGVELGGSAMHDTYDEDGNNNLDIYAVDLTVDGKAVPFMPDNTELLYEGAQAKIERDDFARMSGVADDMDGYYAQLNTHFAPDWLANFQEKGLITEDAHFTFVLRHGMVDLDTYTMERDTVGLNFRPNAHDTVFKFDYQFNDDSGEHKGDNDEDAFIFSVATYF